MEPEVAGALQSAVLRLTAAGVDSPRLDAELLLAQVLSRNRTYLFAHPERRLQPGETEHFAALVERRVRREPLPYLLGRWEFLGLSFRVGPGVLIPRPETECLVEAVAARARPAARVLEVGAGSGCIAIGLAHLRPDLHIVTLEPDPQAAEIAKRNAGYLGVATRVQVIQARFPDALDDPALPAPAGEIAQPGSETPSRLPGLWDVLVSNPPYIPTSDLASLQPEVRDYEPRPALDGGPDGLLLIRALIHRGPQYLARGGLLALEIGCGQAAPVETMLSADVRWGKVTVLPDLAGIPRVVLAVLRET